MSGGNWITDNSANRLKRSYLNEYLDISNGDLIVNNGTVKLLNGNISASGNTHLLNDCSLNSKLFVQTDLSLGTLISEKTITIGGNTQINANLTVNQYLYINNSSQITSNLYASGNMIANSRLLVNNDTSFNSKLYVKTDLSINGNIRVGDAVTNYGTLTVVQDISLNSRLFVLGDTSFNSRLFSTNTGVVQTGASMQDTSFNSKLFVSTDVSLHSVLSVNSNIYANAIDTSGYTSIRHNNPIVSLDINSSDAIKIPNGSTAQRPVGANGYIRYNRTTNVFEGYSTDKWIVLDQLSNSDKTVFVAADTSLSFYTASLPRMHLLPNDISINNNVVVAGDVSFNKSVNVNGIQLGGVAVQATPGQLNYIAIDSVGLAQANKAIVLDTNNDISGITNVTINGNLVSTGNLLTNGTTSVINTTNTDISNNFILINSAATYTDAGAIINQFDVSNLFMGWSNANTGFVFGNTSLNGASTSIGSGVLPGIINTSLDGSINLITGSTVAGNLIYGNSQTGYNRINNSNTLSYNPATTTLTASSLTGNLTGQSTNTTFLQVASSSTGPAYLSFVDTDNTLKVNAGLTVYPSTGRIVATTFTGTVSKSVQPNITTLTGLSTVGTIATGQWNGTVNTLANNAITSSKIVTSANITDTYFASNTITSSQISTISNESFKDGSFLSSQIQDGTINSNKLNNKSVTIGTSVVNIGGTLSSIDISGNISSTSITVGNSIIGNLVGNVVRVQQALITTLPALSTIGSAGVLTTSSGPIINASNITVTGSFNQGNGNIFLGQTSFAQYPSIVGTITATDTSSIATKEFVDSFSGGGGGGGGSSNLITINTADTITSIKQFKNPISQQIITDPSYIKLSYDNATYPTSIVNENTPNGLYALAKDAARTVLPEISDRTLSYWVVEDSALTTSDIGKWKSICWSPKLDIFCAIRESAATNNFATSPDGILWTRTTTTGSDWKSICWAPEINLFCAVGTNLIATSSNGSSWTIVSSTRPLISVCWSNLLKKFCAICNNQTNVIMSSNGSTWSDTASSISNSSWYSITWSPELELFCAITSGANFASRSSDGITWTNTTNPFSQTPTNADIVWSSELSIFCVIMNTTVSISSDATTWSNYTITPPASSTWGSIVWSPEHSLFCAINRSSNGWGYSFNGKEWFFKNGMTSRYGSTIATPTYFQSVCWSPELNRFCTVGYTGTGTASDKGITATCSTIGKPRVRLLWYSNTTSTTVISQYGCEFVGPDASNNLNIVNYTMAKRASIVTNPASITAINFTGQHRCYIKSVASSNASNLYGLIVSANNNKHVKMNDGVSTGNSAITINESLPFVSICKDDLDSTCFGVISESESTSRIIQHGVFASVLDKEDGDIRVIINSVGEGSIWVSNKNGILESGDYITTSVLPGYGQRQSEEFQMNYTVAKITMDCNFEPILQPVQKIKTISTVTYQNTNNTLDIISESMYNQLLPNEQSAYIKLISLQNELDELGNIQWINSDEYEYSYNVRHLSENGEIISYADYNALIINNSPAFIAAFVSCTYHCG